MFNAMIKARNKKGFTLVEMLIVIAIIAILIAIAIPVYNSQMERAREAVDRSTRRAAISIAAADYMLNPPTGTDLQRVYTVYENTTGNITVGTSPETGYTAIAAGQSKRAASPLTVTIGEGGTVVSTTWDILESNAP